MSQCIRPRTIPALLLLALPLTLPVVPVRAEVAPVAACPECRTATASPLVACTVLVPTNVVEIRMQPCVVYETKERKETYTVFERREETRTFKKECWYLKDEVKNQEITEKRCQVVMNPVERTYKVQVPVTETRQETVRQEICTPQGLVCVDVPCTREVTTLREEERSLTCQEPDVVFETTKRQIDYCIKVPEKVTKECARDTVYKLVPVEKERTVQACVPKIEYRPIEATVCKLLPKTVQCCATCAKHHR